MIKKWENLQALPRNPEADLKATKAPAEEIQNHNRLTEAKQQVMPTNNSGTPGQGNRDNQNQDRNQERNQGYEGAERKDAQPGQQAGSQGDRSRASESEANREESSRDQGREERRDVSGRDAEGNKQGFGRGQNDESEDLRSADRNYGASNPAKQSGRDASAEDNLED